MKKKIVIILSVAALLLTGAFIAWLISDAFRTVPDSPETGSAISLDAVTQQNAGTVFQFMTSGTKQLPDNMRGYIVDPETDFVPTDVTEEAVRQAAADVFKKVDAILPNTVVIRYSAEAGYDTGSLNTLSVLIEEARKQELTVILSLSAEEFPVHDAKADDLLSVAEAYKPDGIMLTLDDVGEDRTDKLGTLRDAFAEQNCFLGVSLPLTLTETTKKYLTDGTADFYFIRLDISSETGAEALIRQWAAAALSSPSKVYAVVRNDLVRSGSGWTKPDEVNTQVKMLYNNGGFAGCVMASREKLSVDDNDTATNLYSYYEYFNDVKYTALTLTGFSVKDGTTAVFTGTSDKAYPVHVWCSAVGSWQTVAVQGDDGAFTAEIPLREGTNKILVKHKNALYTYSIDRAVDVLTETSAVLKDGKTVTLTATAMGGSQVWAALANTVLVELTAEDGDGRYVTYSAEIELTADYAALTDKQISFAATYNGLNDIVMCGETKKITPYDDHGLGTSTMCEVTGSYAETTSSASKDDSSDPTCTPQLTGAYAYIDAFTVSDNHVTYTATNGLKLYASDARLIVGGYVLPDNNVTLQAVSTQDKTTLTFSATYPTFSRIVLEPQDYYTGYLQRIYNVESFTAEYLDLIFMDTAVCSMTADFDFSGSNVVSRSEWYANSEAHSVTLRLYLKEAGKFGGYTLTLNENGEILLTLKPKTGALSGCVIMLDPGHGGYGSPGTSYQQQVYEKDLTLAIALKAAALLREQGATVILTREEDEAVFLRERANMIRQENPDLFVSIHCDGADASSWLGTHTFYYKSFSMPLASAIHQQLVGAYRSYYYTDPASKAYEDVDKGIKFFPYNVTRVEECPSVLVECGYLTNDTDAAFLRDENGRTIIATAIAQGIVDYIMND